MKHIICKWPSLLEFANDLGVPYQTAAAWKRRDSIPATRDLDVISAGEKRGIALTLDDFAVARSGAAQDSSTVGANA